MSQLGRLRVTVRGEASTECIRAQVKPVSSRLTNGILRRADHRLCSSRMTCLGRRSSAYRMASCGAGMRASLLQTSARFHGRRYRAPASLATMRHMHSRSNEFMLDRPWSPVRRTSYQNRQKRRFGAITDRLSLAPSQRRSETRPGAELAMLPFVCISMSAA